MYSIGSFLRHVVVVLLATILSSHATGQNSRDGIITLECTACLGTCPDYKVTIHSDGSVEYEGHRYVRMEGARKKRVPASTVQKLVRKLQDEDFFHWEEKKMVCVDFPEVHITATINGQTKHVLEGCNTAGKVVNVASEIDRVSRVKDWVGNVR